MANIVNEPSLFELDGTIIRSKIAGVNFPTTDFDLTLDGNGNVTGVAINMNAIDARIQQYLTTHGYVPAP